MELGYGKTCLADLLHIGATLAEQALASQPYPVSFFTANSSSSSSFANSGPLWAFFHHVSQVRLVMHGV